MVDCSIPDMSSVEGDVAPCATPKRILEQQISLDDDGLPQYLSKIGPAGTSTGAASSSSSAGFRGAAASSSSAFESAATQAFYIRSMMETDPLFLEEAYKAAASYHTASTGASAVSSTPVVPQVKKAPKGKAKAKAKARSQAKKLASARAKAVSKKTLKHAKQSGKGKGNCNVEACSPVEEDKQSDCNQSDTQTVPYDEEQVGYRLEKYYKLNAVGIRRKHGDGKQVFSLRSKTVNFEDLLQLAAQTVEKLLQDCSEPNVDISLVEANIKQWAKDRLQAMSG